jgi:hypothetical protein
VQKFISEIGHGKFILKCVATSKNFTKSDQDAKWISPVFESTPASEYIYSTTKFINTSSLQTK